jgi:hypothetical protein
MNSIISEARVQMESIRSMTVCTAMTSTMTSVIQTGVRNMHGPSLEAAKNFPTPVVAEQADYQQKRVSSVQYIFNYAQPCHLAIGLIMGIYLVTRPKGREPNSYLFSEEGPGNLRPAR